MAGNPNAKIDKRVISLEPIDLERMSRVKGPQFSEGQDKSLRENWYHDNTVVSSKYTALNFIPKNLFMV